MAQDKAPREFNFDAMDADAVCEQCGNVNPEGTIICKTCGNNLRDQRARRIAATGALPHVKQPVNHVRLLTGLLPVFGILLVLLVVLNMPTIESWLVSAQAQDAVVATDDLWTGATGGIMDELAMQLDQVPSNRAAREDAVNNPIDDTSFNGRYALFDPQRTQIIGEAIVSRRGDKMYFVARLDGQSLDIRGIALLEQGEEGGVRPAAMETPAAVLMDGRTYPARGFASKNEDGGHVVYAQSDASDANFVVLAYRLR
ncbi:MAG: zinc ribbon domain-containing protein [Candidatus Hydrogenedentales bacterium]